MTEQIHDTNMDQTREVAALRIAGGGSFDEGSVDIEDQ